MSIPQHVSTKHTPLSDLPVELIEALNQTFRLHLLVTEPHKVIPPGKSLLSMMTHANFKLLDSAQEQDQRKQIETSVKEEAHRAFWNEALEHLSSPLPSVQLPRLRQLYFDLHEALAPLFPANHPIPVSLNLPLPPTSSPLLSSVNFLAEILTALRQRCAPIRDEKIDNTLSSLSNPPSFERPPYGTTDPSTSSFVPLAQFVIEHLKAILRLAEDMKTDLNAFVIGSMTEEQLQGILFKDVKVRERELVLKLWSGKDVVRGKWRTWLSELPSANSNNSGELKWIRRLFWALRSDQPVYCKVPSTKPLPSANGTQPLDSKISELPPQLFFSTPLLLYIQNCLQAIIISAALRSLTRLSVSASPKPAGSIIQDVTCLTDSDFMTRIWALLKEEIDEDYNRHSGNREVANDPVEHTRIPNLAEEVIRARRQFLQKFPSFPELSMDEEKRLRDAVDRTLRPTDPVFQLLRNRLINTLESRIIYLSNAGDSANSASQSTQNIPTRMQTGKNVIEERSGKRQRLELPHTTPPNHQDLRFKRETNVNMGGTIPGFDDIVLQQGINDVLQKIAECIAWVEAVWGDLV